MHSTLISIITAAALLAAGFNSVIAAPMNSGEWIQTRNYDSGGSRAQYRREMSLEDIYKARNIDEYNNANTITARDFNKAAVQLRELLDEILVVARSKNLVFSYSGVKISPTEKARVEPIVTAYWSKTTSVSQFTHAVIMMVTSSNIEVHFSKDGSTTGTPTNVPSAA